jgi:sucrose-6F-phosphate phosphohydrolase
MIDPSIWLVISDVDDTLLGVDHSLENLAEELRDKGADHLLVYNSSRPIHSVKKSLKENHFLPNPSMLIGALGTEIEDMATGERLEDLNEIFDENWDRDRVVSLMDQMDVTPHPEEFQTRYKYSCSVYDNDHYQQISERIGELEFPVKLVFSAETNLDIIPVGAGKGAAIGFLKRKLRIDDEYVVVAGDSANDLDMFILGYKGIVVGNADPVLHELSNQNIYHAKGEYADGVLEGLYHWRVLPERD